MKAVGLASLMARAGLFIPAEIANVPWFDDVLAVSYTHLTLPTICSV